MSVSKRPLSGLSVAAVIGLGTAVWWSFFRAPEATWAVGGKTGVGTSYAPYGPTRGASKVWYSTADGVLTEVMYGLIHQAQIKSLIFAVRTPSGLVVEGEGTDSEADFISRDSRGRPLAPALRVTTRDREGRFEIEKHIFSDPDRPALFLRVIVRSMTGPVTPYLLMEPRLGGVALHNHGEADATHISASTQAAPVALSLTGSVPFAAVNASRLGGKDGYAQLKSSGSFSDSPKADGILRLAGALAEIQTGEAVYDFALGFGTRIATAQQAADETLKAGYSDVLGRFLGRPQHPGWHDYMASLSDIERLAAQSTDGGHLAYVSAITLKVHEDKTFDGALIASLSSPWGHSVDATEPATGYKGVWPRDFYQCAMALLAAGDRETPIAALRYLKSVQVSADKKGAAGTFGWFQQKSHVDGTPEWVAVQMDQTAMPIMLAHQLWQRRVLTPDELSERYQTMLKPAAEFLVTGGKVQLGDNRAVIAPPATQQERWEEQGGYSPSTIAAEIAGLIAAGDIARAVGDADGAARYEAAADRYSADLESQTATRSGRLGQGRYYLRLSPTGNPDDRAKVESRNGRPEVDSDLMVDAGFLELVRYGVRRADDPLIAQSLRVIDDRSLPDNLRVRYDFSFGENRPPVPGFRRYGEDGYGEDEVDGQTSPMVYRPLHAARSRGRVWPIFTGERGHFELAKGLIDPPGASPVIEQVRETYVRGMEQFANKGLMLPEQVYDGVGPAIDAGHAPGQGTHSATPLAWAHAEYLKLLRSVADRAVYDLNPVVSARYQSRPAALSTDSASPPADR